MGCDCEAKKRGNYENIRKIAERFARTNKVVVAVYRIAPGEWSFVDILCPEYHDITPIEYISPMH